MNVYNGKKATENPNHMALDKLTLDKLIYLPGLSFPITQNKDFFSLNKVVVNIKRKKWINIPYLNVSHIVKAQKYHIPEIAYKCN